MFEGARQLPTMHVSVRVPWHDQKWSGRVCNNPQGNTSCLVLKRIADNKDDEFETSIAGTAWNTEGGRLPACAAERGAFMSPSGYLRSVHHPYSNNDPRYTHFRKSLFHHPPFSAAAVPYAWMMRNGTDGVPEKAEVNKIDFQTEREPDFNFETPWTQERRNQLAMLDTFFGAITPQESLVFFYAKHTPLTDDNRRVIVGIGRVLKVDPAVEYTYENRPPDALRCVIWERSLHHSIRPEIKDGFLLPYHDLIDLSTQDPSIDLSSLLLYAPEEHWDAFSMGAEHVTHDQAITVLLACSSLLERIEKVMPGNWSSAREWIDAQLNRIWRLRGAFPGLGSALTAFGLTHGTLVAHAIGQQLHADGSQEVRDPWPLVEKVLHEPTMLSDNLSTIIGPTVAQLWDTLKPERKALLKLLARFEITADQATRWFVPEERSRANIKVSDGDILANPYLCFENDRGQIDSISATAIDRGLFPDATVATKVPVPDPSHCGEAIDRRRVRALMITTLDQAANEGHTLLPQSWLVQRVRDLDITPRCMIGSDWIEAFGAFLKEKIGAAQMADDAPAWQLNRYMTFRDLISTRVRRLLAGKRHTGNHNWRTFIDQQLPPFENSSDPETEESARREKAYALEEVYRSRFSVLIGPAGTGKTSLLTALLSLPPINNGGVLLLAPTGKARVQMQKRVDAQAYTLAQFLLKFGRYDPKTGNYHVSEKGNREKGFKTVVIDECSMLTEDQLAATLDAIETTAIERLILAGDPRQLPPIGAGRPFVDIVRHLVDNHPEQDNKTPYGYAELKIVRRQIEKEGPEREQPLTARDDIVLSRWFGGETPDPGADEAWARLESGSSIGIKAIRWKNDNDLQEKILGEIKNVTRAISHKQGFDEEREDAVFEISLGGRPYNGVVYFNLSRQQENTKEFDNRTGGGADAETWQILSPVRAGETGVDGLNRKLQKFFRRQARAWAEPEKYWQRKVCKPMGTQGILYGDKVINVTNGRRRDVFPRSGTGYLANGEIGTVVGQYKGANWKPKGLPWKIQVEFSSQLGFRYGFGEHDFGDESDAKLELAYALTIHKAQGSEFGITFVIVPNPCRLLSRELLYTALTRQREKVILFHQGELRELLKLSLPEHSETARRLTNLFSSPKPIEHADVFLEEGLIHRTTRGELVRSKSEVIIANLLHNLEVPYAYEQQFTGQDGSVRYPDFTIEDAESGQRIFLEHLGVPAEPAYQRRWQAKLDWYRSQGVSPEGEEEGETGILITTTEENGIDSADIERKLRAILAL